MGQAITAAVNLAAATATNIALSQSPAGAGNLTLNGATVSGGVATLVTAGAALVIITSGGDDHLKTFTIYGTDESGIPQSEALAGGNIGVATSTLYYKTVTRIAISAASAGTVTVGTSGVGVTRWFNWNHHAQPCNVVHACVVAGAVNYDLQYTYDPLSAVTKVWTDPGLAGQTASGEATYSFPIKGSRVILNSGTGTVTVTAIQAGIDGG